MKKTTEYFDLQLNGHVGTDFNADGLVGEKLHKACEDLKSRGVTKFLATVVTDDIKAMCGRLRKIVELREQNPLAKKMIAGIHIEGPFLNAQKGYRGGHHPEYIKLADIEDLKRLLDAAGELTKIVTLAPENDENLAATRFLAKQGIVVSAGHCNPSLEQLRAAVDAGLSMFTHMSNGAPAELPRHDNIIQRALSLADKLWLGLIADGVHIPFFVLKNYLKVAGVDRCFIVSDAMMAAGLGPGRFSYHGWDVLIGEDLAARSPDGSHLVGSAISMDTNAKNLREHLGLSELEIRKLTWENPHKAIGMK